MNSYFQFKQFTIYQDRSAMKVTTDSCLFGAWVAAKIASTSKHRPGNVLDIGAGTGLLMNMIAQQFEGHIDGIEIDNDSYEQAVENLQTTAWRDRINLLLSDVKTYIFPTRYDLIVSNPPFYKDDLKSDKYSRNLSKHDVGLTLAELMELVAGQLTERGQFAVLLPSHRLDAAIDLATKYSLFLSERMSVRQTTSHGFFREMLVFENRESGNLNEMEMSIKGSDGNYSPKFVKLLEPYYLYL